MFSLIQQAGNGQAARTKENAETREYCQMHDFLPLKSHDTRTFKKEKTILRVYMCAMINVPIESCDV